MAFDLYRQLRAVQMEGRQIVSALPSYRTRTRNPVQTEGYSRSPVYQAERRVRAGISQPWVFTSIIEVQMYGYNVLARVSDYDRASWPLRFEEGSEGRATYQAGTITTPVPVVQMTILHELSHHLTSSNDAGHDADFVQAYVYLLRMEMGQDIAQKLLDNMT
jgi:hypothetical protein